MKRVLFISRSTLSQNLLKAVLPLAKSKVGLVSAEDLTQAANLPKKGKPFHVVLVDWNTLKENENRGAEIDRLKLHPLVKTAHLILIHPHKADIPTGILKEKGFKAFYTKPFMTDELAQIIMKWTKET